MTTGQTIYRIIFSQDDKVYEIYARYLTEESLIGFIEIEELLFNESSLVVDPSEEKIRAEFQEVKRSYIPLHHVLRIDEVVKKGSAKIKDTDQKGNVHHLGAYRTTDRDR
ncbi:MAG: hypothetical protein A3F10_00450 [Coxiella sp. RIFCSPHIGHO2_12_FULL_42_15]|nr:MAG: hypothetical protein A3F10_00450 [Coxiella sp. RIFCSPHIGHO2_12_FULL_42_15]